MVPPPLSAVCVEPDGSPRTGPPLPAAVLPGSFNPLHHGHTGLAAAAERLLGVTVEFELSVVNVDKAGLTDAEAARRAGQFRGRRPVWLTRAPTFAEKARLFPGAALVVGFDTAVRLIDPRYYAGDPHRRDAALRQILDVGGRVVVGGRLADGRFCVWDAAAAGLAFVPLFVPLPEEVFRADVSSTELRAVDPGGTGVPPVDRPADRRDAGST